MAPPNNTGIPSVPTPPRPEQDQLVIHPQSRLCLHLDVGHPARHESRPRYSGPRISPSPPDSAAHAAGIVSPEQTPDWDNLSVIHRNTLPPRSYFFLFNSEDDARANDSSRARGHLLSGLWGFHLTNGPLNGPRDFYKPDYDNEKWPLIQVPGMW
jgi:hypothetical protein